MMSPVRVRAVVFGGEANQVGEQIVAQVEFDIAGDADENHAHPVLEDALEQREAHQVRGVAHEDRAVDGRNPPRRGSSAAAAPAPGLSGPGRVRPAPCRGGTATDICGRCAGIPTWLNPERRSQGFGPLHEDGLAAFAILPPVSGSEELVARGDHAQVRAAAATRVPRSRIDAPRPGGVVVAGHQQEAADLALASARPGRRRPLRAWRAPVWRSGMNHSAGYPLRGGQLNRRVGFVDAVEAGRSADQHRGT